MRVKLVTHWVKNGVIFNVFEDGLVTVHGDIETFSSASLNTSRLSFVEEMNRLILGGDAYSSLRYTAYCASCIYSSGYIHLPCAVNPKGYGDLYLCPDREVDDSYHHPVIFGECF